MEYETLNTKTKNQVRLPLLLARPEPGWVPESGPVGVFRLILARSGSGVVQIDDVSVPWFSPAVICVNEREKLGPLMLGGDSILFAFNPTFLNLALEYGELRKPMDEKPPAVVQNNLLMWPFISRSAKYRGVTNLGPEGAVFMLEKLEAMEREIAGQTTGWWPCRTRAVLTEVLFQLAQYNIEFPGDPVPAYAGISGKTRDVISFLCERYREKLAVEELAARFGTNRTSLNAMVKDATGLPVNAYMIDLRLRKAALLLSDTQLPVAEIAERVGIEEQSNFIRLFRKKYANAPGEYRKLYNAEAK